MTATTTSIDPIVTEIVQNALTSIADEMSAAVIRSAYSTSIKEGADASAAILDVTGAVLAQAQAASLVHICSLRESVRAFVEDFPEGEIGEGDVFAMNDPARGGVHANDVVIARPVFVEGRPAYFTATLVHVADLGGVSAGGLPAQATEIYHEGLLIPPVRLWRAGREDAVIHKFIRANSRSPEKVVGDITALVGACNVGASRLDRLIGRYGGRVLREVIDGILTTTELRTRREIERLPEGGTSGSFTIDDDGIDPDVAYEVRVWIERKGSDLLIDFAGTDLQAKGPINAAYSQAMSGAVYGARCFLDPTIPMNEGFFRPLQITFPAGTIVSPHREAAVNARYVTVTAIIEAMLDALSKQREELSVAASATIHMLTVSGRSTDDGSPWIMMTFDFGGVGARRGMDGVDATGALIAGGRGSVVQLEALEAAYPLVFERFRLATDSGGAGEHRGGLGHERTFRLLADAELSVRSDRMRFPPPGKEGGSPGAAGAWIINAGRADEVRLPSKQMNVHARAGDTVTMLTCGGGGMGRPERRDADAVRADVLAGFVSHEQAAAAYGVVLGPGPTFAIDRPATELRRQALRDHDGRS